MDIVEGHFFSEKNGAKSGGFICTFGGDYDI
jgi:hypothetical protein